MDVARLNFSHGDYADHEANYKRVRAASDADRARGRHPRRPAGPEDPARPVRRRAARTGPTGETVRITVDDFEGTHDRVSTTYKRLAEDATPGTGCWSTTATSGWSSSSIDGNDVVCTVTEGGAGQQQQGHVAARHERPSCPRSAPSRPGSSCSAGLRSRRTRRRSRRAGAAPAGRAGPSRAPT